MAAIDLVIFDCDGVLVDSEPLAIRVLVGAMQAQGIEMSENEAFHSYLGRSLASISASLEESHGAPLGKAALGAMRDDLYALYRRELKPMRGIADALQMLNSRFCVASSSSIERIRLSLELTGLLPLFEGHIFSASMVSRGKPAPDLFLHAAREMGAEPARCLVIEDSPAGIAAARAAGMSVFAFTGGTHIEKSGLLETIGTLGADDVFSDMRTLPDRLGSLQQQQ